MPITQAFSSLRREEAKRPKPSFSILKPLTFISIDENPGGEKKGVTSQRILLFPVCPGSDILPGRRLKFVHASPLGRLSSSLYGVLRVLFFRGGENN